MLKNKLNVRSVEWAVNHFSWPLVDDVEYSVQLEEIPSKGKTGLHIHKKSSHFYFVLEGNGVIKMEGRRFILEKHEGIEVPAENSHQIMSMGDEKLVYLVISCPSVEKADIFPG